MGDIGGEGAGDRCFDLALGPVVEQHARSRRACRRVGDVVGEHRGGVRPTGHLQGPDAAGHDPVDSGNNVGGRRQVSMHDRRIYPRVTDGRASDAAGHPVALPSPCVIVIGEVAAATFASAEGLTTDESAGQNELPSGFLQTIAL